MSLKMALSMTIKFLWDWNGGLTKLNQHQPAYIAIEALITLIIIIGTMTWFLVNQVQMATYIKQQENKLTSLRIEKEHSDEKLQMVLQK